MSKAQSPQTPGRRSANHNRRRDEPEDALAPVVALARTEAANFSRARRLSAEMVARLRSAGIYRALVPSRFGGDEMAPADFLRVVERIAEADGSTGWVASFGCSPRYLAGLPLSTQAEIYRDGPDMIFAGATYPPRPADRTSAGYRVSGRWAWMSGITGAEFVGVSIGTPEPSAGGLPLMAVMPATNVKITGDWNTIGLRGTGSFDVEADAVEVGENWVFVRGGPSSLDTPLFRYPSLALAAQSLAIVALGCARGAVEELKALAKSHTSITGAPGIANRPTVQADVGKAEAELLAARAFFYEVAEEAFDHIREGAELDVQQRALLRLSATHVAHVGANVARAMYRAVGSAAVFEESVLARHFLDAAVVPQHAFLADATYQGAGAILLGLSDTAGPAFP